MPLLKQHGYLEINDPDPAKGLGQQSKIECDTITCGHCGCLIQVPVDCAKQDMPYALCWGCRRHICLKCDGIRTQTLKCDVIENWLEREEDKARFRREL